MPQNFKPLTTQDFDSEGFAVEIHGRQKYLIEKTMGDQMLAYKIRVEKRILKEMSTSQLKTVIKTAREELDRRGQHG